MHPTEVRTNYRQRRREKDITRYWDTSAIISRWYTHVLFHPSFEFQRFLHSSIFRDYDAAEWICQHRSRDENVARPSCAISLERTENTLFHITCHASECLLLQTEKVRTTHTRSSVIVPELDLIHCITDYDRLSKVQSSCDNMTNILDKRLT